MKEAKLMLSRIKKQAVPIFLFGLILWSLACNAVTGGTPTQPSAVTEQPALTALASTAAVMVETQPAPVTDGQPTIDLSQLTMFAPTQPSGGDSLGSPVPTADPFAFCEGDTECIRIHTIVMANPNLPRPIRVSTEAPSCSAPAQNDMCGLWASGNHSYVTAYSNQWTAAADFKDSSPIGAGTLITFDHADGTYAYILDNYGEKMTVKMAEVSFVAPTANVPGKPIHYWTVPVTAPWGPADHRNSTVAGATHPCYSYGLQLQYAEYLYYENADELMALNTNPDIGNAVFVGKDDFVSCQVLKIVPNNEEGTVGGAWVLIDGQKLWSRFVYFNNWPDPFWAKNKIEPPL